MLASGKGRQKKGRGVCDRAAVIALQAELHLALLSKEVVVAVVTWWLSQLSSKVQ